MKVTMDWVDAGSIPLYTPLYPSNDLRILQYDGTSWEPLLIPKGGSRLQANHEIEITGKTSKDIKTNIFHIYANLKASMSHASILMRNEIVYQLDPQYWSSYGKMQWQWIGYLLASNEQLLVPDQRMTGWFPSSFDPMDMDSFERHLDVQEIMES